MKFSLTILGCSLLAAVSACPAADTGGRASEAALGSAAVLGTADRCATLAQQMRGKWPDSTTRILKSEWLPAGSEIKTPMGSLGPLPQHCELMGILHERVGSDGQHYAVHFHLRLPEKWNVRLFFEGGGGTEGDLGASIGFIQPGVAPAIAQGYAVVSQDAGHDNGTNTLDKRGGQAAFGFDAQARADYGGASLKPVAMAAKAAIAIYYAQPVARSYFVGCSKGGQEGMALAQRYPEVFDGIVAAAPGFSLPRAAVAEAWDTQAFASLATRAGGQSLESKQLPATFSDGQFGAVREAILAACDADDGVSDGITAAFSRCTWPRVEAELKHRECSVAKSASCLSSAQVAVLGRVFGGPKDSKGKALYSDWPIDAGAGSGGWRAWKIGPPNGAFAGINATMGASALATIFTTEPTAVAADPQSELDYSLGFNFDRDAPKIYATAAQFHHSAWADIAARSPHLEAFRAHGGKMIVPQGASDPVFSLNDTLAWYREVQKLEHGTAADFVRVFPVPGMAHCAGGPATDQFSAFAALVAWVEEGRAPDEIPAKAGPGTPWPGRTRPLCPYPKEARYLGTGSIEDAKSFSCR